VNAVRSFLDFELLLDKEVVLPFDATTLLCCLLLFANDDETEATTTTGDDKDDKDEFDVDNDELEHVVLVFIML